MTQNDIKELVFVYNARKGLGNAMLDSAHKLLDPDTYSCNLCRLTHGLLKEKGAWKKFREKSGIPMKFLHKEEFLSAYASKFGVRYTFPIILANTGEDLEVFMTPAEINRLQETEALIRAVTSRLPS